MANTGAVQSRCRVGTGCNRRRLLLLDFIACSPVSVPVWLQPPCTGVAEPEPADAPVGEIPTLPVSSAPTPTVRLLAPQHDLPGRGAIHADRRAVLQRQEERLLVAGPEADRKSTRLNSSH